VTALDATVLYSAKSTENTLKEALNKAKFWIFGFAEQRFAPCGTETTCGAAGLPVAQR